MRALISPEFDDFLAVQQGPQPAGLRVNTLKASPDHFVELSPFHISLLAGLPAAFLVDEDERPGRHPYHAAGLYYLQDPSAMVAAWLLHPQPGERVLDLSAAPGGKTTHMACLMEDKGLLAANEIDRGRAWDLAENLERWGARQALILNESPARLAEHFAGYFDRVLLDAPCSGEGMFGRSEAARQQWSPAFVKSCALRQSSIIQDAAQMVRPGGSLAYVTCTFSPEEDEMVVAEFMRSRPDFELVDVPRLPGFSPGRPDWSGESQDMPVLERAVRLWPHMWPGGGQFIAVMRNTLAGQPAELRAPRPQPLPATARSALNIFWENTLNLPYPAEHLYLDGAYLYQRPELMPDLVKLSAIRQGWWLGEVKGSRFEPSHALALGLRIDNVKRALDLHTGSQEVENYLHGEALSSPGEDGWTLVAVDGFPLGWGKRVNGLVKNHFPKGLRFM